MLELKAKKRKKEGKEVERLREEGLMPAVLYGPEVENLNLVLEEKAFNEVFKKVGEAAMFRLEIKGEDEKRPVLVKEVQIHPLTDQLMHADFYQPILGEKVESTVPLVFEGVAPAVKEKEGVLVKNISEVEVSALPTDLPAEIKVDVTGLKDFDDVVCIRDIEVSSNVEILREPGDVVATVSAPKSAEELMEEMERTEEEELFVGEEVPIEEETEELGEEGEEEGEEPGEPGEQEGIEL